MRLHSLFLCSIGAENIKVLEDIVNKSKHSINYKF